MIKSKLAVVMATHPKGPLRMKDVAQATNIRLSTVSDIYYSRMKRLNMDVLNALCKCFECQVGDLLEYVPDPPDSGGSVFV